jgi:hypothetical protein
MKISRAVALVYRCSGSMPLASAQPVCLASKCYQPASRRHHDRRRSAASASSRSVKLASGESAFSVIARSAASVHSPADPAKAHGRFQARCRVLVGVFGAARRVEPLRRRIARALWPLHNTSQARIDWPVDKRRASHSLQLPRFLPKGASRVR